MDGQSIKPVTSAEQLARFIFFRNRLRKDWTVKPDEFIPYPYPDLSVTRHINLTETEIWNIGRRIAQQREKPLLARADVQASSFERHRLRVVAAPIADNPNHANVTDWPTEKSAQKAIAQEISAVIGKARKAPTEPD
ncbi:MAG: hypothetical protein ACE5IR_13045 [bacterium]